MGSFSIVFASLRSFSVVLASLHSFSLFLRVFLILRSFRLFAFFVVAKIRYSAQRQLVGVFDRIGVLPREKSFASLSLRRVILFC